MKEPAFITIVLKLCNIVNVKSTTKGIYKGLKDANVIIDTNDRRLQWLYDVACWLKLWNTQTKITGYLSKETFTALLQTLDILVFLVKDLLDNHKLKNVLVGKLQTDNLEVR